MVSVFNDCREWFSDKPGSSAAGLHLLAKVTVELKLGLPQVAVVGSQSSGKSSVLEALVRSRFLHCGGGRARCRRAQLKVCDDEGVDITFASTDQHCCRLLLLCNLLR